jgi:hypothetical protein
VGAPYSVLQKSLLCGRKWGKNTLPAAYFKGLAAYFKGLAAYFKGLANYSTTLSAQPTALSAHSSGL